VLGRLPLPLSSSSSSVWWNKHPLLTWRRSWWRGACEDDVAGQPAVSPHPSGADGLVSICQILLVAVSEADLLTCSSFWGVSWASLALFAPNIESCCGWDSETALTGFSMNRSSTHAVSPATDACCVDSSPVAFVVTIDWGRSGKSMPTPTDACCVDSSPVAFVVMTVRGRSGRSMPVAFALLWAAMVSLSDELAGLVAVVGLLVVGFGFAGCFASKPCCLVSSACNILYAGISRLYGVEITNAYTWDLSGHNWAKAQNVPLIPSLTPGFASPKPFLMHFSISSMPPACSSVFLWWPCFVKIVFSQPEP